jgi:hypothetical protein
LTSRWVGERTDVEGKPIPMVLRPPDAAMIVTPYRNTRKRTLH